MSGIVERLREWSERTERAIAAPHRLCDDAADEITRLRTVSGVIQDDMAALMQALGISTHARDASPHEVMVDEVIPEARRLRERVEELEEALEEIAGPPAISGDAATHLRLAKNRARRALRGETDG